jgi:hypothetical protein
MIGRRSRGAGKLSAITAYPTPERKGATTTFNPRVHIFLTHYSAERYRSFFLKPSLLNLFGQRSHLVILVFPFFFVSENFDTKRRNPSS